MKIVPPCKSNFFFILKKFPKFWYKICFVKKIQKFDLQGGKRFKPAFFIQIGIFSETGNLSEISKRNFFYFENCRTFFFLENFCIFLHKFVKIILKIKILIVELISKNHLPEFQSPKQGPCKQGKKTVFQKVSAKLSVWSKIAFCLVLVDWITLYPPPHTVSHKKEES